MADGIFELDTAFKAHPKGEELHTQATISHPDGIPEPSARYPYHHSNSLHHLHLREERQALELDGEAFGTPGCRHVQQLLEVEDASARRQRP